MENIFVPNALFDFSKLSLAHPIAIQGGAFFTKIEFNEKPLYIQTTKSLTKQGIFKSGKKHYCDLMFTNSAAELINWFEKLEETCQGLILDKKETWFQTPLDKNDIENAFNSTIKTYKSGKYYLIRTSIKQSLTNTPNVSIYDENKISRTCEDITNETEIISILELQGIKFTSRNFQLEVVLKQIMMLDKEPIFDNCLIKTNKYVANQPNVVEPKSVIESIHVIEPKNTIEPLHPTISPSLDKNVMNDIIVNDLELLTRITHDDTANNNATNNDEGDDTILNDELSLDIVDLDNVPVNSDKIEEITNMENNLDDLEPMQLKKPNHLYHELYKKAREKAKQAKKEVILACLEAKNIKNTYMIDNLSDEEYSILDEEIDEVSESELEGL